MAKQVAKVANPLRVGNAVLVRTVTHIHTGRIVLLTPSEIVLSDAAWIADTGRFYTALRTGALSEVEPFPHNVAINRGAVVDVTYWEHDLPRSQK